MKGIARFKISVIALLLLAALTSQAQRTTTHTDETSNNTTGCAASNASYVGTTSCQANFPGANDDASAGTDRNTGANTVTFDAVPKNVADFASFMLRHLIIPLNKDKSLPEKKRTGNVNYMRDPTRFVSHYFLQSLLMGVKKSFTLGFLLPK